VRGVPKVPSPVLLRGLTIDELRLHGQNKELVDEVVRLSKKYGIITEYTSFLVDADYRLALRDLAPTAEKKLKAGLKEQVGAGAVNRAMVQKDVTAAVRTQRGYVDAEGKEHRVTRMAQIGNRTFFKKDGLWVDSEYEGKIEAVKVKSLSEAYFKLLSHVPEIGRFLALGDEVIFFLQGQAIHVSDEGKSEFTAAELKSLLGR
jgi:Ca-activated chloride channel family protein